MSGPTRTSDVRRAADDRVQRILATIDSIPRGRVATYGQVAAAAGLAGRARLVGATLRSLPRGHALPWFRVLGAGGAIRTEGRAALEQAKRLRSEGIAVARGRVDLAAFGWAPD